MQLVNAMVAISNDRNNVLWKQGLTPIEVVLLQQLHGQDAVTSLEPTGDVDRTSHEEIARLRTAYPMQIEKIQNLWRDYPGDHFPMRLRDLSLNPALLRAAEASAPYTVSAKPAAAA